MCRAGASPAGHGNRCGRPTIRIGREGFGCCPTIRPAVSSLFGKAPPTSIGKESAVTDRRYSGNRHGRDESQRFKSFTYEELTTRFSISGRGLQAAAKYSPISCGDCGKAESNYSAPLHPSLSSRSASLSSLLRRAQRKEASTIILRLEVHAAHASLPHFRA
jgi:hypothetical protein